MVNEKAKSFNWDSIEKRDMSFINIDNDIGEITIKMLDNKPFDIVEGSRTKYGKDIYMFKCLDEEGDERVFSTSSNRCMMELKTHAPLKNKTFKICKSGSGMETQYEIIDLEINN